MSSINKDGFYECEFCGGTFHKDRDGYHEEEDTLMCLDCYDDENCYYCGLCEESFEEPDSPDKTFFIVSKSSESEYGIPYGLYRAKTFPFMSIPVVGDITIWESDIELVSKIDIESIINKRKVGAEYVCEGCFDKYKNLNGGQR